MIAKLLFLAFLVERWVSKSELDPEEGGAIRVKNPGRCTM